MNNTAHLTTLSARDFATLELLLDMAIDSDTDFIEDDQLPMTDPRWMRRELFSAYAERLADNDEGDYEVVITDYMLALLCEYAEAMFILDHTDMGHLVMTMTLLRSDNDTLANE